MTASETAQSIAWRISQYMLADDLTTSQLRRYACVLEYVTLTTPNWRSARAEMTMDGLQDLAPALAADLSDLMKAEG